MRRVASNYSLHANAGVVERLSWRCCRNREAVKKKWTDTGSVGGGGAACNTTVSSRKHRTYTWTCTNRQLQSSFWICFSKIWCINVHECRDATTHCSNIRLLIPRRTGYVLALHRTLLASVLPSAGLAGKIKAFRKQKCLTFVLAGVRA